MEGDCNVYAHSSLWMRPTGEWSINAKMVYSGVKAVVLFQACVHSLFGILFPAAAFSIFLYSHDVNNDILIFDRNEKHP